MAATRHCARSSRALVNTFTTSTTIIPRETTIPAFLVPALAQNQRPQTSHFSTSSRCASKIGKKPLSLPQDVTFTVTEPPEPLTSGRMSRNQPGATVEIAGPLGKIRTSIPAYMSIDSDLHTQTHRLDILDSKDRTQREMWGTVRAYLENSILGVSEGHAAILRLVGVGFRATIESTALTKEPAYPGQKFVSLKVGYSHPIELGIPEGVKASTPQPTRILLEGMDKRAVMQFAAEIRAWRKPEPYKGKGIFVNDETVRLKAKKIK